MNSQTATDLENENARLRHALTVILNGATIDTGGHDSGGWVLANVRQAMLNVGREALGRELVEDRIENLPVRRKS